MTSIIIMDSSPSFNEFIDFISKDNEDSTSAYMSIIIGKVAVKYLETGKLAAPDTSTASNAEAREFVLGSFKVFAKETADGWIWKDRSMAEYFAFNWFKTEIGIMMSKIPDEKDTKVADRMFLTFWKDKKDRFQRFSQFNAFVDEQTTTYIQKRAKQ